MKGRRILTPWRLLAGLLLLVTLAEGLKGTALVISKLKQKPGEAAPPLAESRSSEEEPASTSSTENPGESLPLSASGSDANATTKSPLTGIPQKDYVHDPNLPRELNGYNLTEYPFYDRVPDEIDFKCDGLHDGFYASVLHKCQVYHHCLFGTRYDFLCANYTAFDQRTFICHFVSEVDCINSPKYFKRNEALYKQDTTTTVATTTTTVAATPPPQVHRPQSGTGPGGRRRRPYRRRRPMYDYYYDDYEDDQDYYEDEFPVQRSTTAAPPLPPAGGRRRKRPRPQRPLEDDRRTPVSAPSAPAPLDLADHQPEADLKPRPSTSLYDRPRVPPKIRRPVPVNERNKYDYTTRKPSTGSEDPSRTKPTKESDYYDYEEDYSEPARNVQQGASRAKGPEYYPASAPDERDIVRRPTMTGAGRPLRRNRPTGASATRRRPESAAPYPPLPLEDEGDDDYEEEVRRPVRPSRKRPQQADRQYSKPTRYDEEDTADEPVPASRPAYISTAPGSANPRPMYRKRVQPEEYPSRSAPPSESTGYRKLAGQRKQPSPPARQPAYAEEPLEEDDYYDEEEVPEQNPQHRYRNRQKPPQRAQQPINPIPPTPPPPPPATIEDDDAIVPPQRPTNGKRPFLPSRSGNPTLPRGLQPLGVKAPPQNSRQTDNTDDKTLRVPQPIQTTSYRPKLEEDRIGRIPQPLFSSEDQVRKPKPALSDAITSRPVLQTNFKTSSKTIHLDSSEEEHLPSRSANTNYRSKAPEELPPRVVPSGNTKFRSKTPEELPSRIAPSSNTNYRSKTPEELPPRIPPSAGGNFRNKQASPPDVSDVYISSSVDGKYKQNSPETPSVSSYRPEPDEISLANAKTSPPLLSYRDEGSRPQPLEYRPPSNSKQALVTVYRTPVKIPDLPARTNLADIDENEYDVTLNDALHPTLHPRSVATGTVTFPQQQQPNLQRVQIFKTKIASSPSSSQSSSSLPRRGGEVYSTDDASSSTGGRGYLVGAASQRQATRAPFTSLSDYHEQQDPVPQRRPQYSEDPPRNAQTNQYHNYESLPLLVSDVSERPRQNFRRNSNVGYSTQY